MPDQLRIGVLGAGQIAQAAHLEACRKARNAELYALCDAAEDLLATVAADPPAPRDLHATTTRCSPTRSSTR